jgi:hypothetical protein
MFSDSLVVWGKDAKAVLPHLQRVYLDLINKNLLLRGAIVNKALVKEPRVEVAHFRKFLPTNDTLARAVGLEKTVRGARLLIEPLLATKLLEHQPEWLSVEGYLDAVHSNVPEDDVLRRICPTPSGTSHELLFFWRSDGAVFGTPNQKKMAKRFKELTEFHDPDIAEHLRETLKLLRRCEFRRQQTASH